jgi:hypothetical protein
VRYALALLTHGEAPFLEATLESFYAAVDVPPVARVCVLDGQWAKAPSMILGAWDAISYRDPKGFCGATSELWRHCAAQDVDWVFWIENDFLFHRSFQLEAMAATLLENPHVLQMALCRNACNDEERAAGGLLASRRGWFHDRETWIPNERNPIPVPNAEGAIEPGSAMAYPWFEHGAYWTTNPSLFHVSVPRTYEWPTEEFCEGKFGIRLRERNPDIRFGLWGDGAEWVEHVGQRTGYGY